MAHATADIGTANYTVALVAGHHSLTSDEGRAAGGQDAGPSPHEMLCAALGACTAITLSMYAQRKEWPLHAVHVDVLMQLAPKEEGAPPPALIKRLVKRTTTKIVLEQFNPPKMFDFAVKDVLTIHKIVGSGE